MSHIFDHGASHGASSFDLSSRATQYWILCTWLGTALAYIVKKSLFDKRHKSMRSSLPPGPTGLPILGNVLQIPQEQPWIGYNELSQKYGDLVYLNALGLRILVVGNLDKAVELMDKRSANYSDRPALTVFQMTKCSEWNIALMPYGSRWRALRRTFHTYFNSTIIPQYRPVMQEEVKRCLGRLRETPEEFLDHVRLLFGTIIMRAAYGFDDIGRNKSLIKAAEQYVNESGETVKPANFLVNIFPSLRYVPEWFPGTGWRQALKRLEGISARMRWQPFEDAKANANRTYPSMAVSIIDNLSEDAAKREEEESLGRDAATMAYIGGADTTVSSATALILALASHPEVQRKARAELDDVLGGHRLPSIDDRDALPYVHAIVKEVGRWFTVVPMGVGHLSVEDDTYDGYFIPKGTMVMPNAWAMMHDPNRFEDPFAFKPERYLRDGRIDPLVPDGEQAAFGFGRRMCPGRHFSNDTLFLFTASLLSTFTLEPPKDEFGATIPLELKLSSDFVCKPLPFQCTIQPRPGRDHLIV